MSEAIPAFRQGYEITTFHGGLINSFPDRSEVD
jgi:hypothetical protein